MKDERGGSGIKMQFDNDSFALGYMTGEFIITRPDKQKIKKKYTKQPGVRVQGKIINVKNNQEIYKGWIYCSKGCFNPIVDCESGSKFKFNIEWEQLIEIDRDYNSRNLANGVDINKEREKKNAYGRTSRFGDVQRYYCGGKLETNCDCCDGNCGPDDGCNCKACMKLDIESRFLGKN